MSVVNMKEWAVKDALRKLADAREAVLLLQDPQQASLLAALDFAEAGILAKNPTTNGSSMGEGE